MVEARKLAQALFHAALVCQISHTLTSAAPSAGAAAADDG
jgi:hypothetical protein